MAARRCSSTTLFQRLRLSELVGRLVHLAETAQDGTECVVHGCARLLRQRTLVILLRFFELPLRRQHLREVVVCRGEFRIGGDRLAILCDGLVAAPLSGEDISQTVVGLGGGASRK